MPAASLQNPVVIPANLTEGPVRKRFTRTDVERMLDAGIFEGQRFELIDGELIYKMEQKPPHSYSIQLVLDWLASFLGTRVIRVQLSIEASGDDRETSEPEPDIAVLAEMKSEYQRRHPRGNELLLVVEVSDTTRAFDLGRKAMLYASAGVAEYWVLDLNRRMLVVHRQPDGEQYRLIQMFAEEEMVSMQGRTETVKAGDLLPALD
jgi:Uma2 family endonuclease